MIFIFVMRLVLNFELLRIKEWKNNCMSNIKSFVFCLSTRFYLNVVFHYHKIAAWVFNTILEYARQWYNDWLEIKTSIAQGRNQFKKLLWLFWRFDIVFEGLSFSIFPKVRIWKNFFSIWLARRTFNFYQFKVLTSP